MFGYFKNICCTTIIYLVSIIHLRVMHDWLLDDGTNFSKTIRNVFLMCFLLYFLFENKTFWLQTFQNGWYKTVCNIGSNSYFAIFCKQFSGTAHCEQTSNITTLKLRSHQILCFQGVRVQTSYFPIKRFFIFGSLLLLSDIIQSFISITDERLLLFTTLYHWAR